MTGLLKRLGCLVGRHAPSRRAVQYKGHLKKSLVFCYDPSEEKRNDGRWAVRKVGAEGGSFRED